MRTLNRPMFRMGGPIKEGVMHGIREPHRGGGRAALVGNPMYPSTMGREHHSWYKSFIPKGIMGSTVTKKPSVVGSAWDKIKGWTGTFADAPHTNIYRAQSKGGKLLNLTPKWVKGGQGPNPADVGKVWTPKGWVARDPTYQIGKKIYEGRGWLGKPIKWAGKAAATPTGAIGLTYVGGKWLWPDGKEATDAEVNSQFNFKGGKKPGRGDAGMTYTDPEAAKKLAAKKRDERITNLLETMGYDAAKKDAVSKALIDASQIVSDRGTLDKKNITAELINPIIQATSKRLEKPEQLNEAVRLMLTKAEIEKEMNPLDDAVKRAQLAVYQKQAKGKGIQETLAEATGKGTQLQGETLASVARSLLPGDFKVMQIKVPKNTDTLEHIVDVVKESHTNPEKKPFPPGQYVLKERIVVIDEKGNVTPLDI